MLKKKNFNMCQKAGMYRLKIKKGISKKINMNHFVLVSYLCNKAPKNLTVETNRHLLFQVSVSQASASICDGGLDSGSLMRLQPSSQPGLLASPGLGDASLSSHTVTAGSP